MKESLSIGEFVPLPPKAWRQFAAKDFISLAEPAKTSRFDGKEWS